MADEPKRTWGGARPGSGPRRTGAGAKARPVRVAAEPKRSPYINITDSMLELARQRPPRGAGAFDQAPPPINPFLPAQHPPIATPKDKGLHLAMDEAAISTCNWGYGALNSLAQQGLYFFGYPFLSELAQRPEYRIITECISVEMTRKWIKFQAKTDEDSGEDKSDKILELEDAFEKLRVRDTFREAAELDGFFGRGHIFIDTGDTDDDAEMRTPLGDGWDDMSASKVNQQHPVQALKSVEPVWSYPLDYGTYNPLKPDWYKPKTWGVMQRPVHASRLQTFIGREVPDMLKPAYSFGGLSMSQMAKPYVDRYLRTAQSVTDLVHAFSIIDFATNLGDVQGEGGQRLFARMNFFNLTRDNRGMFLRDKDKEELKINAVPLGTLDAIWAKAEEGLAFVGRIPIVKLLGIQPAGLNASSEGELVTFEDMIHAYQRKLFTENLRRIMGFVMLSIWGKVDPDITFEYQSLRDPTPKEEGELDKQHAEADQIRIDSGVISPEEARARVAADADSPYHGLDPSDVPEPPEEPTAGEGGNLDAGGEQKPAEPKEPAT